MLAVSAFTVIQDLLTPGEEVSVVLVNKDNISRALCPEHSLTATVPTSRLAMHGGACHHTALCLSSAQVMAHPRLRQGVLQR